MAGYHDIVAYKGSAFRYHFKLMDENDSPVNLIGVPVKMQVKKSPLGSDVILDFTVSGVTVNYSGLTGVTYSEFSATGGIDVNTSYVGISGDTGGMYVYAPSGIMDEAPIGNWTYSLSATISGDAENLVQGRFIIDWNATT
jgi:hypothetical protein